MNTATINRLIQKKLPVQIPDCNAHDFLEDRPDLRVSDYISQELAESEIRIEWDGNQGRRQDPPHELIVLLGRRGSPPDLAFA